MRPESELAWNLDDYLEAGEVPPERVLLTPDSCEGELMTSDEIAQFLKDGQATLMILRDSGSEHFERVRHSFLCDLDFLLSLGRIDEDDYNELTDPANYSF